MEQADEIDAAPFFTYSCQIKYLGLLDVIYCHVLNTPIAQLSSSSWNKHDDDDDDDDDDNWAIAVFSKW